MEFLRQYWIFSSVVVLVVANDFHDIEVIETDFVEHFGNKEYPIKWNVARHFYDFKTLVKICDHMKVLRKETGVISDLKINGDENSKKKKTSKSAGAETSKNSKQVPKNQNLGQTPGVLIFRNKNYKSRVIDVLRCEIANTKHLRTGRRYVYVGKGKTRESFYLLSKAEATANKYLLDWLEYPRPGLVSSGSGPDEPAKSEPEPNVNGPLLTSTVWSCDA